MKYAVDYREAGTEQTWTTIACFDKRADRDTYIQRLCLKGEPYRTRSRTGKVLKGALYRSLDIPETNPEREPFRAEIDEDVDWETVFSQAGNDAISCSYIPTLERIAEMCEMFRANRMADVNESESSFAHLKEPGRAALFEFPANIRPNMTWEEHEYNGRCDSPVWWEQIGG
jgi:hypothetical protein